MENIDRNQMFDAIFEKFRSQSYVPTEMNQSNFEFLDQDFLNQAFVAENLRRSLEDKKEFLRKKFLESQFRNPFEKIKAFYFLGIGKTSVWLEHLDIGGIEFFRDFVDIEKRERFNIAEYIVFDIIALENEIGNYDSIGELADKFHQHLESEKGSYKYDFLGRVFENFENKSFEVVSKFIDDVVDCGYDVIVADW